MLIKASLFLLLALFSSFCLGCAGSAAHLDRTITEDDTGEDAVEDAVEHAGEDAGKDPASDHVSREESTSPEEKKTDTLQSSTSEKSDDGETAETGTDALNGMESSSRKSSSPSALAGGARKTEEAPPMDRDRLMLAVIEEAGSRFTPVRKQDGSLLMMTADLDRNGREDPLVLTIEKGETSPIFEDLSDVSRLYDPEQKAVHYYLSVYFQLQGKLVSMYRIPFGGRKVLGSFRSFLLKDGEPLPLGVEVTFQNREGTSQERVLFSRHNRFSLFSSTSTVSTGTYLEDIDKDGTQDLVEWKTGIEEGTGYETFLTWYRWNGSAFQPYRYTNIVRNLNRFLEEVESALLGNSLDTITRFLPREDAQSTNGDTPSAILQQFACKGIQSIVYPPILESPFRLNAAGGRSFHLDLRILCETGETGLFRVEVTLQDNPFKEPQFSLSLP